MTKFTHVNYDELVASLPDPAKDERPPDVGTLTKTQIDAIRAARPNKSRRSWSNPAEQMMCRILESAFGARNVVRESDMMQGFQDKGGVWHYNYANYAKPDITFAVIYNELMDGVMEVKSCAPGSAGLDVTHTNIKPWQIRSMDKAADKLRVWGLVFWSGKGQARCFVVPHERFMEIIKVDLPHKAVYDGRFQGRSLRRKRDLDLLEGCEVLKSNKWYLPEDHWFLRKE